MSVGQTDNEMCFDAESMLEKWSNYRTRVTQENHSHSKNDHGDLVLYVPFNII